MELAHNLSAKRPHLIINFFQLDILQQQFLCYLKVLEDVTSHLANVDFSDGQSKENRSLNRYKNKLPCEFTITMIDTSILMFVVVVVTLSFLVNHTRVYLRAATTQDSTYICASFVRVHADQ